MMEMNSRVIAGTMLAGTAIFISLMGSLSVHAQDVTITDGPCRIRISTELERTPLRLIEVEQIRIFAKAGEDKMLIRLMDSEKEQTENDEMVAVSEKERESGHLFDESLKGDLYVKKDDLQMLLPRLDLDVFPQMEEVETIPIYTQGDNVRELQEVLISLGFLEGPADGDYGGGTAESVRSFQDAHDLEVTGTADPYTMMLILAVSGGLEDIIETSTKGYGSADEKFPEIANKTEANLDSFLGGSWSFQFDVYEEKGAINPGIALGNFEVESPEIDRIRGSLSIKVVINKDEDTKYFVVTPAIVMETSGAYRPYVQGAVLVGDTTVRLDGGKSSGNIAGVTLEENGYVPLNTEALELLETGSVHTIRLLGKNTSYDVEVTYDAEKITACMEDCRGLTEE